MQCRALICQSLQSLYRLQRLAALVVALVGLWFVGAPSGAKADGTYQAYHLYLYQTNSDPVDVTSTLFTSGGNTYVVLNGNPIEIMPNYQSGHIFDGADNLIGFYYLPDSPRQP